MATWLEPQPTNVPPALQAAVGGHPLVAEVLARRGLANSAAAQAFLDPDLYTPASPFELPDMDRAVARVQRAISQGAAIAVWGDFDVDGQTATTLLVATLRGLGARVTYHIPVRDSEGHGISIPWLQRLIDDGVGLVITCDTGVAAHAAVEHARSQGVDVVVTDHHDLPEVLPAAAAVVNPKRLVGAHPLATLPGVGVAYKLAEALYQSAGRGSPEEQLDLVALGIVADLALQVADTRYLLQRGLANLRQTHRPGLQAMMALADVNPAYLSEEHVGFELAPRLNALGRLGDANLAVEFLSTQDVAQARLIATQLEGLNNERKRQTDQVFQGVLARLEREPALLEQAALVVEHPAWPAGIIGIVASRLVEHFNRPVVLLAALPGEMARGSARSVEGCNITAAIAQCEDLLVSYGGHPMAAGLSLEPEHIPLFRRRLSRAVQGMLGEVGREPVVAIDGVLALEELTLDLVADLERLAPFGPGNPGLVLASTNLSLLSATPVGRNREHVLAVVEDQAGIAQPVIWWQGAGWPLPEGRFDLAYRVRASTYRGQRDVQVAWVDARPIAEAEGEVAAAVEVVDHRGVAEPLAVLRGLQVDDGLQVWREGEAGQEVAGTDRYGLQPAATLVVWTTPPGRRELQAAMTQVHPERVVLFGRDPGQDSLEHFLRRLAGLVKHTLAARQGRTSLPALAAATAQREAAVRLGLHWLAAKGHVHIEVEEGDVLQLAAGTGDMAEDPGQIAAQLKALLDETAAYRRYFAQADAGTLV